MANLHDIIASVLRLKFLSLYLGNLLAYRILIVLRMEGLCLFVGQRRS